jgi:hypothetical protein
MIFQNPPYMASRYLLIPRIEADGTSFSPLPCQAWHGYMVTIDHRVEVEVCADGLASAPPSGATAGRRLHSNISDMDLGLALINRTPINPLQLRGLGDKNRMYQTLNPISFSTSAFIQDYRCSTYTNGEISCTSSCHTHHAPIRSQQVRVRLHAWTSCAAVLPFFFFFFFAPRRILCCSPSPPQSLRSTRVIRNPVRPAVATAWGHLTADPT